MDKLLLLLSVIGVAVALPMVAARAENPRRGLLLCLPLFVGFNVFYFAMLFYVFPRLL